MAKAKRAPRVAIPFYKRWSTYLYATGFALLFFIIYIVFRIQISDRKLFTLSFIPIFLGIIYEHRRLSTEWKIIVLKVLGAFILSFFAFLPGRRESDYNLENHIETWPFWFLILFIIISVIIHDKKVVPKLTEGITLIQSLSICYWIIDFGLLDHLNVFSIVLISLSILISIYSIVHAFSYTPLSRKHRLSLSIWSSIIMIVFAIEHIFSVFHKDSIEDSNSTDAFIAAVQYFILGVSSMYILQNFFMLATYLPSKRHFFDKTHLRDIKEMNISHIKRYSDKQVLKIDSFICLLYCILIYTMNYKFQIVHRQTAIWIVIISVPYLLYFKEKALSKND